MTGDVVVHGGGPAGYLAALAFYQRGAGVTLVEREQARAADYVQTVAPEFALALGELGLGERWRDWAGKRPVAGFVSAWETESETAIDAEFNPYGPHQLAMRSELVGLLRGWVVDAGVELARSPVSARGRLEIDATGPAASIARRSGGDRRELGRLVALLGKTIAKDAESLVLAEALSDGWCFAAPSAGAYISVAFYTDPPARGGRTEQAGVLAAALAKSRLIGRHADLSSLRYEAAAPAVSAYAEPAAGPGWLAVGGAALTADPLSSSGLAFAAASAIEAARASETGNFDAYERFVSQRVARFRIERQGVYARAARRFGTPFWAAHASLAARSRTRKGPGTDRSEDRSAPAV